MAAASISSSSPGKLKVSKGCIKRILRGEKVEQCVVQLLGWKELQGGKCIVICSDEVHISEQFYTASADVLRDLKSANTLAFIEIKLKPVTCAVRRSTPSSRQDAAINLYLDIVRITNYNRLSDSIQHPLKFLLLHGEPEYLPTYGNFMTRASAKSGLNELVTDLEKMYESANTDGDVTLRFVDGSETKAHSNILAARSEYFEKMFRSGMSENVSKEIRVPFEKDLFTGVLNYLYTGAFPSSQNPREILPIADMYLLPHLKEWCENRMKMIVAITNLKLQSIENILIQSSTYNCPNVKKRCFEKLDESLSKAAVMRFFVDKPELQAEFADFLDSRSNGDK